MDKEYEQLLKTVAALDTGDGFMLADGKGGFWAYENGDNKVVAVTMGAFCKVTGATPCDLEDLPDALRSKA